MIYVVSHERSGTHLAINCMKKIGLADNFVSVPPYSNGFQTTGIGPQTLIKTHANYDKWTKFTRHPVVYVVRDPRDVMTSFYHYLKLDSFYKHNKWADSRFVYDSPGEFLQAEMPTWLADCQADNSPARNVVQRWCNHLNSWAGHLNQLVRFRDMVGVIPFNTDTWYSVAPRSGIVGDHKNLLTGDDERFIEKTIKDEGLWELVAGVT